MSELFIAFLWHMHQPWYLDPATGVLTLPWVRLHAAKDYVDMVERLSDFPHLHQTFNLTPCLLEQLAWYAQGGQDAWGELAARPTETLNDAEQAAVARQCTFAHTQRMVAPLPHFYELFARAQRGQTLTVEELRDLVVWFNLVWIDPRWRAQDPRLAALVAKAQGFTEADKAVVLAKHRALMMQVVPAYRAAQDRGQVEVSTSPYAHPILPLLADSSVAQEATPGLPLPRMRYAYPEDVTTHLRRARETYARHFGGAPSGLWPSEGAVSAAILPAVAAHGFQWLASDEAILWKSLGGSRPKSALYQPHRIEVEGRTLALLFRDRELSDAIGFSYAGQPAAQAVADFLQRLHRIRRQTHDPAALVTIALDGENAWEHYPNDGEEFLSRLYEALSREDSLRCVTVSEYLAAHPPQVSLGRLAPGSWIRGDFTTWIGDDEKNQAWELLAQARSMVAQVPTHPPHRVAEALTHLLIAEGSDWFWWYGPEHTSAHDEEFDRLFRQHLAQVYRALDRPVPTEVHQSILKTAPGGVIPPSRWGTPVVDGLVTDYFEWLAAGRLECAQARGATSPGQAWLKRLWWLCDRAHWYLRMDLATWPLEVPLTITLTAEAPPFKLDVILSDTVVASLTLRQPDGTWGPTSPIETVAARRVVELAIPFVAVGLEHGKAIVGRIQVEQEGLAVDTVPPAGTLVFTLPEESDAHAWWSA